MRKFPPDFMLRVEVVLALFARVVDLENMWECFDLLPQEEQDEARHRLGYMNMYNPVHPDRFYKCDLTVRDHRELAKVLVKLAVVEPGENWVNERYRRNKTMDWIPGWELPKEWGEEPEDENDTSVGIRRYGLMDAGYTSTGRGCNPDYEARRALQQRFLCGGVLED